MKKVFAVNNMDKQIRDKLNEILDFDECLTTESLSKAEIKRFEHDTQIRLPREYKKFLMNFFEAYVGDYQFPMKEKFSFCPDGISEMDYFYVESLFEEAQYFFEEHGKNYMPIAPSMGDFICMGLQGNQYGKIYYWWHEEYEDRYHLIADSFHEFILSFGKFWDD